MKRQQLLAATLVGAVLSACGGSGGGNILNGSASNPPTSQANLNNNKLQLAVGTAFNANDGSTSLNVVETFRQTNGLSAVLADQVALSGPFTVTGKPGAYGTSSTASNCTASPIGNNVDDGTGSITTSPQVPLSNAGLVNSTLGTFTGAFSYGLAPLNSDQQNGTAYFPGNPNNTAGNGYTCSIYGGYGFWPQPFWAPSGVPSSGTPAGDQGVFVVGPPAVPFFNNGTFPAGFAGYSAGFTAFEFGAAPPTGTYTMKVTVPTSNASNPSFTATASLNSNAPMAAPVLAGTAENGGGLTGTVTPSAGSVETLVFVWDQTAGLFYTVEITGTGAQAWTLPATLGACSGVNCQTSSTAQKPSLNSGDFYQVSAVSFDYQALEAGPPTNTQQTPTIAGASGQVDLAIGTYVTGTY